MFLNIPKVDKANLINQKQKLQLKFIISYTQKYCTGLIKSLKFNLPKIYKINAKVK